MENLLEMLLHDARNQPEDAPVSAMGLLYPGSRIEGHSGFEKIRL